MDNTPKLQRRSSLSLTRLNKKRHSASPQNIVKTAATNNGFNNRETISKTEVPRSPSIISISDCGIECTPPHKKKIGMCVDDCGDYSPKVFDNSFSPSCLLSQTLAIDSPEVGWKWSRYSAGAREETSTRTPDSAYAADSSFTSAGSSSTEMTKARTRNDNYHQRLAYDVRREQELRRVEKTLADQKLKQRCAKLQEQFKCAATQKSSSSPNNFLVRSGNAPSTSTTTDTDLISQTTPSTVKRASPMQTSYSTSETFNDFFNDSDEDCFLLAATQEIESKINGQQQNIPKIANSRTHSLIEKGTKPKSSSETAKAPASESPSSSVACPPPAKEKRSSFYMKFLEDDCTDDWFVSLDEVIEQATQSKKPRTSFQRYKSMPMHCNDENSTPKSGASSSDPVLNGNISDDSFVDNLCLSSSTVRSNIKRHSSTHTLSPSYRGRQHH